ncbi:hypothetical protein A9D60_23375 [Leisingera sp. JC1]|nr:hypothetical protein A9D60_23375 [Leisingera sp. JC1]
MGNVPGNSDFSRRNPFILKLRCHIFGKGQKNAGFLDRLVADCADDEAAGPGGMTEQQAEAKAG